MKSLLKKLIKICLAFVLAFSTFTNVVGIKAATTEEIEWKTSKSKTATNLDGKFESDVTLALPSANYELVSDIVFVLDKSTSDSSIEEALNLLTNLKNQIAGSQAKVKVGVVIFNATANVFGWYDLETGYSDIETAMRTDIQSGTNIPAGLLAAEKMLDDDKKVDADRKYVVLVSDGITYLWADQKDYSITYGFNHYDKNGKFYSATTGAQVNKYGKAQSAEFWTDQINELLKDHDGIQAVKDKYQVVYKNADQYDIYMSYEDLVNEKYCTIDVALYETYYNYKRLSSKYNAYAVYIAPSASIMENHPYGKVIMDKMTNGKLVNFSSIQKAIINIVDAGSTVVDVMGYGKDNEGNDYDFDFINDPTRLKLSFNKEVLSVTTLTDYDASATAVYGFGSKVNVKGNETYQFVLKYYANGQDGKSDECFVWEINVAVTIDTPVELTYGVKLTNPQTKDGVYGKYDANGSKKYAGLYTNKSATLYPVDTNGESRDAEAFPKPTVSYEVDNPYRDIKVTKAWADNNDENEKRPDTITVTLYADGHEVATATFGEGPKNPWEYTFMNLPKYNDKDEMIDYTLEESDIDYYDTTIIGNAKEGFTITNTYNENDVPTEDPDTPNTGDATNPIFLASLLAASTYGMYAVIRAQRKEEE